MEFLDLIGLSSAIRPDSVPCAKVLAATDAFAYDRISVDKVDDG